ncbi:hypothetical protein M9H77_35405 [Catharanthus roseus]|uniref:Uncharacterized protein n=1 Tax=Catharanthus roseus TaxID=4058 RepID=A0ACB9ZP72_CATRO|nr:hypothetical protein M9H77_35405 [Catharanthus roseus]
MASDCEGKSAWPELLGTNGEKAIAIIQSQNPAVIAVLVPEDSDVTGDFRCDRVRVYVNKNNVITRVPSIG